MGRLEKAMRAESHKDLLAHAKHMRDRVLTAMADVRVAVDRLEVMVDDQHWPLPNYREMLFVR